MAIDLSGVLPKYKINRPLTEREQDDKLDVKQSQGKQPHYELSLLKMNSNYAESIDKFYSERGIFALYLGVILLIMTFMIYQSPAFMEGFFAILFNLLIIGVSLYLFLKDAFTYTHYPIRFDRKNRMVYAWKRDGSVLKAKWDDLYFTIMPSSESNPIAYKFVVGHVLAEDGITVKDTFALSLSVMDGETNEQLKNHFEFYRLYMEEGPEATIKALGDTPLYCLPPLDKQRESFAFGWKRKTLDLNGIPIMQILMQVIIFPESIGRWVAMHTSKIPKWPAWVEEACLIDANDPFIRDHSTNTIDVFGTPKD